MSFGFGISDFLRLLEVTKAVYDACRSGPGEYRELSREAKSLQITLNGLSQDAQDPNSLLNQKGTRRRLDFLTILSNCEEALKELQILINKHSRLQDVGGGKIRRIYDSYQVGSTDLDDVRGKLTFHISAISLFLQSLEGSTISRIEVTVNRIYARLLQNDALLANQSSISVASTESILSLVLTNENEAWELLKRELLVENISMAHVMAYREDIVRYLKGLIEDRLPGEVIEDQLGTMNGIGEGQQIIDVISPNTILPKTFETTFRSLGNVLSPRLFGDTAKGPEVDASPPHVFCGEVRDGTFEGLPASMVILHLVFALEKELWLQLLSAHVCVTCKGGRGLGSARIGALKPRVANIKEPIFNSYTTRDEKISRVYGLFYPNANRIGQATWNVTEDTDYAALGIASRLCVGLIVMYSGDSFTLTVDIKTTLKTKWMLLKTDNSGKSLRVDETFSRPRSRTILTQEDLSVLVDDRNKQFPPLPSVQSLIKTPSSPTVSDVPNLVPLITRSSLSNIPPFSAPDQFIRWQ